MKQRVITGVILAVLLLGMMLGVFTPALTVVLAFLSVVSVHEIADCVGMKNKASRALAYAAAVIIPFCVTNRFGNMLNIPDLTVYAKPALIVYVILQLVFMVMKYDDTPFTGTAVVIFTSLAVPESYSVIARLRDVYADPGFASLGAAKSHGIFLILFSFGASWVADVFALFCGMAFGKHKLCPKISPKKTVEGAVGGVLCAAVINCILWLVFKKAGFFGTESAVCRLSFVIPSSLILSVISIFGDLSASVIKRNFGVKDFGRILPGHGGIMDRFDSTLFVWPALYCIVEIAALICG